MEQAIRQKTEALKIHEDVNDNNFEPNGNTPVSSTDDELERVTFTANQTEENHQTIEDSADARPNMNTVNGTGPPVENSLPSENHCENGRGEPARTKVDTPLLPPLDKPVPSDWVTIEDDFILFCASYQSHLGDDYCVHPNSTIDDGLIYLGFVRNAPTGIRMKLLSMMTKTEDGSHIHVPQYEVVKVKAFRLEPLNSSGTMCVDGERVDYGPIQAQILPGIARIMARPK